MSKSSIHTTIDLLIKTGLEIKNRLDSLNQAAEDLHLLNANLRLLRVVFDDPSNEHVIKAHTTEFTSMLDVLQSIAESCAKCAKALDVTLPGEATRNDKAEAMGKKIVRKLWTFNKIPSLLLEIQRKAEQLERIYSAVSIAILQDMKIQQGRARGDIVVQKAPLVDGRTQDGGWLDIDFSRNFASIDLMVGNLMKECKNLRQQLQEAVISPDATTLGNYEAVNPEGVSFWKARFQSKDLDASTLRYETIYVSWARFVHEVETSFILSNIPTGMFENKDVDVVRKRGSRYYIDSGGSRRLPAIRPLWLPALQSALDPLHKGYVKPQDYFNLLQSSSFSATLRILTLENAGYGIVVECEREPGDLPLPASMESPAGHVGWISAQIVTVPTSEDLGIITEAQVMESPSENIFSYFNDTAKDIYVYVRYLQTGQIERKSLLRHLRPAGGIHIGAALSIRYDLESGGCIWSSDCHILEFEALYGGQYKITLSDDKNTIVFHTSPVKKSFHGMLHNDSHPVSSSTLQFDYMLLGPSKVFSNAPKVGEKVQIEYDGYWHDARVTMVSGDELEFVDWVETIQSSIDTASDQENHSSNGEDSFDGLFPEELLTQLGKGTSRVWQPWRRNISRYDIRPYRCLHIGDHIEAPVTYLDFRLHYHLTNESQLYLPARIMDVRDDQYVIEFSPALSAHPWWPGRLPKGALLDVVPGSSIKIENPYDFNRLTLDMDLVRPLVSGPRPVLGNQSAKPSGWSSFQGVHLSNLEDLLEQSLWNRGFK